MEISDPIGTLDFSITDESSMMEGEAGGTVMLAAGTGLTPMLGLIRDRWRQERSSDFMGHIFSEV